MSTKPLVYPYRWGAGIVNSLVEKYARGAYNMARCIGVAPGELRHKLVVVLCSGNSMKWEVLRKAVKNLNEYETGDIEFFSAEFCMALYKCTLFDATEQVLDENEGNLGLTAPDFKVNL